MPRGIRKRKWDFGFDLNQANQLVEVIRSYRVANTQQILDKMQKKYKNFEGVHLRSLKNKINESILPVIIASDMDGYYICNGKRKLKKYTDGLRTQANTMLKNARIVEKKYKMIKDGKYPKSFRIKAR